MERIHGFASVLGRRRRAAAAVAALIVLISHLALQLFNTALNAGIMALQGNTENVFSMVSFPLLIGGLVLGPLAFTVGVYLSLWLLAPVAAELRVGQVIGRSLLAAASGGVVMFLVQLATALFQNFDRSAGLAFGWITGFGATVSSSVDSAIPNSLYRALSTTVGLVPLVVLAGVLVWVWVWLRERSAELRTAG